MMIYSGNLKNDYRLARLLRVCPDKKRLVRTVVVGYRKRDSREKSDIGLFMHSLCLKLFSKLTSFALIVVSYKIVLAQKIKFL